MRRQRIIPQFPSSRRDVNLWLWAVSCELVCWPPLTLWRWQYHHAYLPTQRTPYHTLVSSLRVMTLLVSSREQVTVVLCVMCRTNLSLFCAHSLLFVSVDLWWQWRYYYRPKLLPWIISFQFLSSCQHSGSCVFSSFQTVFSNMLADFKL